MASQFVGRESAQPRNEAVVPRDRMEAQRKRDEPEADGGDPAPPQIADHDGAPSDTVQLAEETLDVRVGEVVEQLRTERDVHALVAKRQGERVGADHGSRVAAGGGGEGGGAAAAATRV